MALFDSCQIKRDIQTNGLQIGTLPATSITMRRDTMNRERIELAKTAIKNGRTRGQFIRENAAPDADMMDLQDWSNAYTQAIQELNQ